MNLTREEKQEKINNDTRYIANLVFSNAGSFKYTNAYNKLKARFYLDWGVKINDRLKESNDKDVDMYDVLANDELDKLVVSCNNLLKMYNILEWKLIICKEIKKKKLQNH